MGVTTPEFTDNFGWSVKIKSIQEELLVCKCVGSFINWETPFADINESNFSPSKVLMSSDRQHVVLALKSSAITEKHGLVFFMTLSLCHTMTRTLSPFYYYNSFLKVVLL